jgi:hypothetical protein
MGNADPDSKTSLDVGAQVLPYPHQVSFCLPTIDFSDARPPPVEDMKEDDFASKRCGEPAGQRKNFHRAFRKVYRQQQAVGPHTKVLTGQF